jgi:hypothetical protein
MAVQPITPLTGSHDKIGPGHYFLILPFAVGGEVTNKRPGEVMPLWACVSPSLSRDNRNTSRLLYVLPLPHCSIIALRCTGTDVGNCSFALLYSTFTSQKHLTCCGVDALSALFVLAISFTCSQLFYPKLHGLFTLPTLTASALNP